MAVNMLEDMIKRSWNNSLEFRWTFFTLHSEGFARPCLSVCEDSSIVAFKCGLHDMESGFIIHAFLSGVGAEGIIKGE